MLASFPDEPLDDGARTTSAILLSNPIFRTSSSGDPSELLIDIFVDSFVTKRVTLGRSYV